MSIVGSFRSNHEIVVACAYLSNGSLSIHNFVLSMSVHYKIAKMGESVTTQASQGFCCRTH